ncbi:hypothetical protein C2G38_2032147 [Gigaspora rosea]|uniref:Uncharacterized protein n=1 Tax=Gigaspora rosea TaxID=44941 RepID=A0A397VRY7_9GLOM|nr:hypothetical protein C2G38_2032147 [Gigaspora rosea]
MDKGENRLAEVGGDVNIIISKNISNNESEVSNLKPAAPNHSTSLFKMFCDNVSSGDSNQVGLENKNARDTDIESNGLIGERGDRKLDNIEVEVDQLLLVMRNSYSDKMELDKRLI